MNFRFCRGTQYEHLNSLLVCVFVCVCVGGGGYTFWCTCLNTLNFIH